MTEQAQTGLRIAVVAPLSAETCVRIAAVVGAGSGAVGIETVAAQHIAVEVQPLSHAALVAQGQAAATAVIVVAIGERRDGCQFDIDCRLRQNVSICERPRRAVDWRDVAFDIIDRRILR